MHLKPDARDTWQEHSASGFNVGTSFEHYRCYKVWIKETRSIRTGNTVFFKHKYLTMPTITPGDAVLKARGHSPIKKPVYFLFRKKTGSIFHATKKKHYRRALVFRGFCDKTLFLPKMAKTTAPPWPILFSAFLLAYAITRKFASRACPQGACPHALESERSFLATRSC